MMRLLLTAALVLLAASAEAANRCVKVGGSDATPIASISYVAGNEAGSTCWASIGRALWGSTTKASPNAAEAAAASDIVYVFAGTYDYSGPACSGGSCRFTVLYDPVNDGTAGNVITLRAVGGVVTVTAPDYNGPILGAYGSDYFTIDGDRSTGAYFYVPACGQNPTAGDECGAGTAAATPDTGAVVVASSDHIVLADINITGVQPVTWTDNWNGVRVEGSTDVTLRNLRIRDFSRTGGGNHNYSGITVYYSQVVIENCDIANTRSGVFLKDNSTASPQTDVTVRQCVLDNVGEAFPVSLVNPASTMSQGRYYQNVVKNSTYGLRLIGDADDGAKNLYLINNLFYNVTMATVGWAQTAGVSNVRLWNNIILNPATVLGADASVTWPAASVIDLEHNAYYGYSTFYTGSDGNRTFASFNSAYSGQHASTPTAIITDPRVVDVVNGDYRLCTGAGAPDAGCAGASPAAALGVDALDLDGDASTTDNIPAGVYVLGTETIGLDLGGSGATVPEAPTIGTATAGNAQCSVTFTPNGTGGAPITSYTVTSSPGGLTGTGAASPISVAGLTNLQAYTFTVVATNSEGNSSASSASNSCTPAVPTGGSTRTRITGEAELSADGRLLGITLTPQGPEDPHGRPFPAR